MAKPSVGLLFVLLSLISVGHLASMNDGAMSYNYVAIIDAGSSGSRMYVYKWLESEDGVDNGVPMIEEVGNLKKKPGLSSLADDPNGVKDHLAPLIQFAKDNIPPTRHSESPVYLMATAGVRLVEASKRNVLFERVHTTFEDKTMSPFAYKRANSRILSGEEEGAFTWISVNYNSGYLKDSRKEAKSDGIVEMGGASAQIAFIPKGQILADKFPVRVGQRSYSLYVHSYLYYGQEFTAKRVREYMHGENPTANTIDNPCMLKGDTKVETFDGQNVTFRGSSNQTACSPIVSTFIWKVTKDKCYPSPCTMGNTYQPPLGNGPFHAVQAFVYTLGDMGILPESGKISLTEITAASVSFCAKDIDQAVAEIGEGNRQFASNLCLMSTYIPLFLHDGLGFLNTGNQLIFSNKIAGKSLDWTVGAVLYEVSRTCDGEEDDKTSGVQPINQSIVVRLLSFLLLMATLRK